MKRSNIDTQMNTCNVVLNLQQIIFLLYSVKKWDYISKLFLNAHPRRLRIERRAFVLTKFWVDSSFLFNRQLNNCAFVTVIQTWTHIFCLLTQIP